MTDIRPIPGLPDAAQQAIHAVLAQYPAITRVLLFGSRAKGTHKPYSDIDLALDGLLTDFETATIALELAELPLPYVFDIVCLQRIENVELRAHIERVGLCIVQR